MRKSILTALAFVLVASMSLVSCGGDNGSPKASKNDTPKDVLEKALNAMKNKDYKGVIAFVIDAESASEEEVNELASVLEFSDQLTGGIKDFSITRESIDDDGQTASVYADIVYNNGEEDKDDVTMFMLTDKGWRMSLD